MPTYTAPLEDMMFLYEKLRNNKHYNEIERVARVAFDLAKKRKNKVTSCEKSNVMEAGQLWKEEVQTLSLIHI